MLRENSNLKSVAICLLLLAIVYATNIITYAGVPLNATQKLDSIFGGFVLQKTKLASSSANHFLARQLLTSQQVSDHDISFGLNIPTQYFFSFRWDNSDLSDELVQIRKSARLIAGSSIQTDKFDGLSLTLKNGRLIVLANGKAIWSSPQKWWVDSYSISDSDNDGSANINLSVWKSGSFGSSMPFWVKENDGSIKNHFFVFGVYNGAIIHVWQSSNLTVPNCEFALADIDHEGSNELVVIEGSYSQWPDCEGKFVAIWRWNGWGFSNEWRSEKGRYRNLRIVSDNGRNTVAVESY